MLSCLNSKVAPKNTSKINSYESRERGTQELVPFCPGEEPGNWKANLVPCSQPPPRATASFSGPLWVFLVKDKAWTTKQTFILYFHYYKSSLPYIFVGLRDTERGKKKLS